MTQPSEPRTKAGRALLASLASGEYRLTPEQEADYTNAILAIEAEAAAPHDHDPDKCDECYDTVMESMRD